MRALARTTCLLAAAPLMACSNLPSLYMFGSYFPAWMLCGLIGIAVAIVARAAFVAAGLSDVLPYQLMLCTAIGTAAALIAWLILYGW